MRLRHTRSAVQFFAFVPRALPARRRVSPRPDGAAHRAERRAEDGRAAQRRLAPDLHRRRAAQLCHLSRRARTRRSTSSISTADLRGDAAQRTTTVLAYDDERVVLQTSVSVPVSKHPIDSVNLADPRLGLLDQVNELLARSGLERARSTCVEPERTQRRPHRQRIRNAADAHDLIGRAQEPAALREDQGAQHPRRSARHPRQDAQLREIRRRARAELADGGARPRPVVVRAAVREGDGGAGAALHAVATGQLPRRSATAVTARARVLRGTYQSPILVQWQPAVGQARRLDISIVKLS